MTKPSSVVAITGGSDGIGLATGMVFARQGWRVAICGRREEQLAKAAAAIREAAANRDAAAAVIAIPVDLCQLPAALSFVDQTLEAWGRLDMLINCAGAAQVSPVAELNDHDFAALWETNVGATFRVCRAALPHLKATEGVIVNISSLAAVDPFPGFTVYGACKAWVDLFTHGLAQEVRANGVRVFALRPGAVETKMLRRWFPDLPAEQVMTPAAVAETVWRLADPAWAPASGTAIPVRM